MNENVEEVEIDEQAKVIVKDRYKMSFLKEPSLFPATLIVNFSDVNVSSSKKIILKSYHEGFNIYNYWNDDFAKPQALCYSILYWCSQKATS